MQVAIVPFATDVNVGTGYVDAPWIDWTDWDAANGTCSNDELPSKSSCSRTARHGRHARHSTWNGCVNDRDQNNDVLNTVPVAGAPATLFRAHQAAACSASMMPLGYDWTALNNKVDAMTPTGNTNVTIGLAWGFQLVSPVDPFNAPPPADDLEKVIVILTDGTNTQNRWSSTKSVIDARTQKVCDNIKAANIKLYTVRVIDGNASLLKGCATKPTMYYDVEQARSSAACSSRSRRISPTCASPSKLNSTLTSALNELNRGGSAIETAKAPAGGSEPSVFWRPRSQDIRVPSGDDCLMVSRPLKPMSNTRISFDRLFTTHGTPACGHFDKRYLP